MSSDAVGELVLPSSTCFTHEQAQFYGADVSSNNYSCSMCGEVADDVQRFLRSPCRCGYQVCSWCWPNIIHNFGGACPRCAEVDLSVSYEYGTNCGSNGYLAAYDNHCLDANRSRRRSYDYDGRELDESMIHSYNSEPRYLDTSPSRHFSSTYTGAKSRSLSFSSIQGASSHNRVATRKALQHLRVIQRNLVYVIGLSPTITANEAASPPYFGQYGRIVKIVMNHHHGVSEEDPRHGSASAYVTFLHKEDAWSAIKTVDGFWLEGRHVRASFGTTKYCNSFLRNVVCDNPDCLYLHELGDERDRFTKDEIQAGLARHGSSFAFRDEFKGSGSTFDRPSNTGTHAPNPILPPVAPFVDARTIYRRPSFDGNCLCCTPKQTLQRHPSGGCLDWSPRLQSHTPYPDIYTHQEQGRPQVSGVLPSRVRLSGLPPIQRFNDNPYVSSEDISRSNIHPYPRQNKQTIGGSPLGIITANNIEFDRGQVGLPPSGKDSGFSTRSNSTLSTRSLSDGSIGRISGTVDGPPSGRRSLLVEGSNPSMGDASPGGLGKTSSPCGYASSTNIFSGLSSIWSTNTDFGVTNMPDTPSIIPSRVPGIAPSPLSRGLGLGFNSTRQSPSNGMLGGVSPHTSFEMGGQWGAKVSSGTPPFWTAALPSPQGLSFLRPDSHARSQSWCGEEERNGLPPPHPNRISSLSFHNPPEPSSSKVMSSFGSHRFAPFSDVQQEIDDSTSKLCRFTIGDSSALKIEQVDTPPRSRILSIEVDSKTSRPFDFQA